MRASSLLSIVLVLSSSSVVLSGCMERRGRAIEPRLGLSQEVRAGTGGFRNVDLLLVVDNSGSMKEEQDNLAIQIPALVRELTSAPDADGDGTPDRGVAERVRIAVVSTDVGTQGVPSTLTERCQGFGDEGAWQSNVECGATANLQEFQAGEDHEAYAARIGCLVEALDIEGCALEQQLDAAARGIDRGLPVGFPAADAILAVLLVTDEEDCSLADPTAFFATIDSGNANVLCTRAALGIEGRPEWLMPIASLLPRVSAGRDHDSFVFAAITGIPLAAAGRSASEILAMPEMQYLEQTGTTGPEPVPACSGRNAAGELLGSASPARRIVELAGSVPGSVLHSICTDDFRPAIAELARRIVERLPSVCLTRAIATTGDRVDCLVDAILPAGERCTLPGYTATGMREDRAVCSVRQAPGGVGSGFFYDDSDAACAKLTFTADAVPPLGAQLEVECYFEVPSTSTSGGPGPLGP
jgi:hypothetical protein